MFMRNPFLRAMKNTLEIPVKLFDFSRAKSLALISFLIANLS